MMCRVLTVSRSGFYAWLKRPVSKRDQRRALVGEAVEATYIGFKKRYGAPRLALELNEQGIACSLNYERVRLDKLTNSERSKYP
jgi:hypothetical protein